MCVRAKVTRETKDYSFREKGSIVVLVTDMNQHNGSHIVLCGTEQDFIVLGS